MGSSLMVRLVAASLLLLLVACGPQVRPSVPPPAVPPPGPAPAAPGPAAPGGAPAPGTDSAPNPAPPQTLWRRNAARGPVRTAIAGDGGLFVRGPGQLLRLDVANGAPLWEQQVEGPPDEPPVAAGEVVVVAGADLRGFDAATGEQRWEQPGAGAAGPAGTERLVYGLARRDGDTAVVARTAGTGAEVFAEKAPAYRLSPLSELAVAERDLYLADDLGVVGLDAATGVPRWRQEAAVWRTSVTAGPGAVFIALLDGTVCALRAADGTQPWCAEPSPEADTAAGTAPVLRLGGGPLLVADSAGTVRALDAGTGGVRWSSTGHGRLTPQAAASETVFAVAGTDGSVDALDPATGTPRWRLQGVGEVTTLVADGATVYVGTSRGELIALR